MKLKIAGKDFKVILHKNGNKDHGTESSGRFSDWHQRIWIDLHERGLDGIHHDLWHEIVEAIDKTYNLQLGHQTITSIGAAIHQVAEQKEFFEAFFKTIKFIKGK